MRPLTEPFVQPLGRLSVMALREAAEQAGQRFFHVRADASVDHDSVLDALAQGLGLPAYFGANLDALYDCLTDLEPDLQAEAPGLVIVLEGLPGPTDWPDAERIALLDTFEDAGVYFSARGLIYRVYWAIRPPGPRAH